MSNTKHTPLPWIAVGSYWIIPATHQERAIGGSTNAKDHVEKFAHVIATVEQDEKRFTHEQVEANAAFIVRAVNSHEQLVTALHQILDTKPAYGMNPNAVVGSPHAIGWNVHDIARAALAAAEAA
jgi:hypothetical protein